MKTRDFAKIGKQLLPYFPGFIVERNLFLRPPLCDFLRGICFENASGTVEFYVRPLFLPLFVPRDHIAFWCDRIRRDGRELWFADAPSLVVNLREAIQSEAIPFLSSVSTLTGALDYLRNEIDRTRPRLSSHTLEAFAYTLIKVGDYPAATGALSEMEHIYEDVFEQKREKASAYVLAQRGRAGLMKEKLLRNPGEALAQLGTWEAETKRNLRLEKYP